MTKPEKSCRAARIASPEKSQIAPLSKRATTLCTAGQDVIAGSTGEPVFPTSARGIAAAHEAALAGVRGCLLPMAVPILTRASNAYPTS